MRYPFAMLLDLLDYDFLVMMQSRVIRWVVLIIAAVLACLAAAILVTGRQPLMPQDPANPVCRYWTGTGFAYHPEFDHNRCPARVERPIRRAPQERDRQRD